jgi:hypothetical protein
MHIFLLNANAGIEDNNAIELGDLSGPSWSPIHSANGTWNELHISRKRRRRTVGEERSTCKVGGEVDNCGTCQVKQYEDAVLL